MENREETRNVIKAQLHTTLAISSSRREITTVGVQVSGSTNRMCADKGVVRCHMIADGTKTYMVYTSTLPRPSRRENMHFFSEGVAFRFNLRY